MAADGDGGRDTRDGDDRLHGAAIVARFAIRELEDGRVESGKALLAAALAVLNERERG
jgi:hypothetical protein